MVLFARILKSVTRSDSLKLTFCEQVRLENRELEENRDPLDLQDLPARKDRAANGASGWVINTPQKAEQNRKKKNEKKNLIPLDF